MWDDQPYVTLNSHVQGGLSWSTVKWAFSSTEASNWHPVTWLSHALDWQLFGPNAMGHHLHSVLLHAVNVVVLFLLLAWGTKRAGPSLLVAALFAVHPLNVESVAWVAERKNVLSTLFFLLAIAAYAWYARGPDWRRSWERYLLVAALFAVGLMAKPMVITLPFVLLLLDYWPLRRMWPEPAAASSAEERPAKVEWRVSFVGLLVEKIPLLVLSAASAWITMKAQEDAVRPLQEFPFAIRIENAVVAYGLYLWKMIWPARLVVLYPHPTSLLPARQVGMASVLLVGVTALVVVFRRRRYLPVGWFWFLGMLVPVIGLVQPGEGAMADRYAYVTLIGIFIMIAWGLDEWAQATGVRQRWRVVVAMGVVIALGVVSVRQMSYWDSEYDLWSHTLALTKDNPLAHGRLAMALLNPDAGLTQQNKEKFASPEMALDEVHKQHEAALEIYRRLVRENPAAYLLDVAEVYQNIGNVDRFRERPDEAGQDYKDAIKTYQELERQNPDLYVQHLQYVETAASDLGALEQRQGQAQQAFEHFEMAVELSRQLVKQDQGKYLPTLATALNNLGKIDGARNQMDDARENFESALGIFRQLTQQSSDYLPDMAGTLVSLGFTDRVQNRREEARAHYEEALNIYRRLQQGNQARENQGSYANDAARVEAALAEMEKKMGSQ